MTKSQVLRENSPGSAKRNCAVELFCTPAERWTPACLKPCGSGGRIDASFAIVQRGYCSIAGRQGFRDRRGNAGGASGSANRAIARRVSRARRGKQETSVSRGSGDGRRSCARRGGSSHAVARLAWDEAERSRARVVAPDEPGFG